MSYIIRPGKNRKQIINNLLASIIIHEKVSMNKSYVKNFIKSISKLVNWAKKGDLHSRRLSLRYLHSFKNVLIVDKESGSKSKVVNKLFDVIGKKYFNRNGGYVRKTVLGMKRGDGSTINVVSFV